MRLTSTWPALARLAWPAGATGLVRISMRTVDLVVVGSVVGPAGVAAVGVADAAARLVLMLGLGLAAGTVATVSQRTGAGDREGAAAAATQTALLAVTVGLLATVVGLVLAPAYFGVLGAGPEVTALGVPYLRIVLGTAAFRMLAVMLSRAVQATGDTTSPMVVRVAATTVNIALTVALVGGPGPFPEWGVVGAAVGTAVGNVLSGGLFTAMLASGRFRVAFSRPGIVAFATGRHLLRVAAPQLAERTLYALAELPLNALVLVFGTTANAGYQVGRRVQLLALMPGIGIGIAGSALVGGHVGRGEVDAARAHGSGAAALASLVSGGAAVLVFALAEPLSGVFSGGQQEAVGAMTTWVRVYALATVFRSLVVVLRGAMTGAGETRLPLAASVVGLLGFLLGFSALTAVVLGMGVAGIQAGVVLDPTVRAALLGHWWRTDRWRRALPAVQHAPV